MTPVFSLENITVRFGGLVAVDSFSMEVEQGAIHALIGPNGAGKSTVFNSISGFCKPATGSITFEGKPILGLPEHRRVTAGIARTFQNVELLHRMTVLENVMVGLTSRIPDYFPFAGGSRRRKAESNAVAEAKAILEQTGLIDFRDTLAGDLDFGRQKSLDVARALASKPRLLLLDEPAAGLRNREIAKIDALLVELSRKHGITIVLIEHVMQLVMSVADRITVLNFGQKIAEGLPAEVRNDPQVVEAYLGRDAHA